MKTEEDYAFAAFDEQSLMTVDFERMQRVATLILRDAGVKRAKLEFVVLEAEPMREMNVQFLGHDYATDVLAFPIERDLKRGALEGSVVVCSDVAQERAKDFNWSPEEELLLYVAHGMLHLVGYDDHSPSDAPIMRAKEREYLAAVGVDASKAREGEE